MIGRTSTRQNIAKKRRGRKTENPWPKDLSPEVQRLRPNRNRLSWPGPAPSRPAALSGMWWTAELVSAGVVRRGQACLVRNPRPPSWPPPLDASRPSSPPRNSEGSRLPGKLSNADRNSDGSLESEPVANRVGPFNRRAF